MVETSACFALDVCPERDAFEFRFLADESQCDGRVGVQAHGVEGHLSSGRYSSAWSVFVQRQAERAVGSHRQNDDPARDPVKRGTCVRSLCPVDVG